MQTQPVLLLRGKDGEANSGTLGERRPARYGPGERSFSCPVITATMAPPSRQALALKSWVNSRLAGFQKSAVAVTWVNEATRATG
jgi:hypothetical protein